MTCDEADRKDAAQIVAALGRVRNIGAKPEYWQEDAFLLTDAKDQTRVILSPMKSGSDLSDLVPFQL